MLGRWVGSQRVYKKQLDNGPPFPDRGFCKISAGRVAKLNADGFLWEIGSGSGMYERANFREAASKMTSQVHDAGGAAAAPRVAKRDLRACAPPAIGRQWPEWGAQGVDHSARLRRPASSHNC